MPVYTVQAPDGKTYQIEGPAGATADQLGAVISGQSTKKEAAPDPSAGGGTLQFGPIDTGIKTPEWLDRGLSGAGKAFSDLGQGVSQYLPGGATHADVAETRKRDAALMKTGAGITGNILGNLAPAVATALIPGANTLTGAGLAGGVLGALSPSESGGETFKNIGIGGLGSAAIPLGITGLKVGKSLIEPFYQSGRNQIMGRALNTAAGGDAAKALTSLKNTQSLTPGVQLTAGEAAGNPGIAAMQRTATAADPVAMNMLFNRQSSNNEALISALKNSAPDRVAAAATREAVTQPMYKQAYNETIQQTPELAALMGRPSLAGALGRGQSLAKEQGKALSMTSGTPAQPSAILNAQGLPASTIAAVPASMTGRDAHLIKMGLDDMANAAPLTGIGGNELRAIQGTRADFLGEVEKQLPVYGQARTAYADLSKPLNQADIIDQIATTATNFRGNLTPAAYARALTDKTAKAVTGQENATLAKTMTPDQLRALGEIKNDLLRADFANTAGRGVGSDTVQKLAFSNMLNQAGVPASIRAFSPASIVGNVSARIGQAAYQGANEQMSAQLAQALLHPKEAAALMQSGAISPRLIQLANGLRRSGVALGSVAPSLVQSNQE